jgi:predicted small metal-binding protein
MRKVLDCRQMPSDSNCSLTISGEEDEVLRAGAEHAVSVHGHTDGPELREGLRAGLTNELAAAGR